jgi:alpha-beta hydrolase superfamily lysophospholipase
MLENLNINGIPATRWGDKINRIIIAVHGDKSSKTDPVIKILAEEATTYGYSVLSFDLPEHGERKNIARACTTQNCIEDLQTIYDYTVSLSQDISLFGCSIGAYYGMSAYKNKPINKAWFLSPVVDLRRLIENIMKVANITPERLHEEKTIHTPFKILDWDIYNFVCHNSLHWETPTSILFGENDTICEKELVSDFIQITSVESTIAPGCEHWFHTEYQLSVYNEWLKKTLQGEKYYEHIF